MSNGKRILISGAGIAGPALAWWLDHFGFEPSIVEVAPKFRSGGYMVDFWGKGFDIVERMGLREEVERTGYRVREVRFIDGRGERAGSFSTDPFWSATDGRFTSIPRGDLAQIVWHSLGGRVPARFGDEIESLVERGDKVEVTYAGGDSDAFDMVIGKRLLINIKGEAKRQALRNVYDMLRDGGTYLMIECFVDPLERTNDARQVLGLDRIKVKEFNEYLTAGFLKEVDRYFTTERVIDVASLYYFISRVFNAALTEGQPDYFAPMNQVAAKLTQAGVRPLTGYAPEVTYVLTKRASPL